MNNKNRKTTGLLALGLGIVGGILLGWGWRRRTAQDESEMSPYRPAALPPQRHLATARWETGSPGQVTTYPAETSWSEPASSPVRNQPSDQATEREQTTPEGQAWATGVSSSPVTTAETERGELEPGDRAATTSPAERQAAPTPEDLTPIEGIGPKINGVLHEAGINTFAQLAETPVDRLEQILSQADISLANPGTWPDQAKLAAAGKWEELKALKEQLDAGVRRTG